MVSDRLSGRCTLRSGDTDPARAPPAGGGDVLIGLAALISLVERTRRDGTAASSGSAGFVSLVRGGRLPTLENGASTGARLAISAGATMTTVIRSHALLTAAHISSGTCVRSPRRYRLRTGNNSTQQLSSVPFGRIQRWGDHGDPTVKAAAPSWTLPRSNRRKRVLQIDFESFAIARACSPRRINARFVTRPGPSERAEFSLLLNARLL